MPKEPKGRPLSHPAVIAFSFMDTLMAIDDALVAKRRAIDSAVAEYHAMRKYREHLRLLNETVAA